MMRQPGSGQHDQVPNTQLSGATSLPGWAMLVGRGDVTEGRHDGRRTHPLIWYRMVPHRHPPASGSFMIISPESRPDREMSLLHFKLLLDQRQLGRPALGRPRHVEPLAQLHLRHEQEHHDGGQTLSAAPGAIGRTPEPSELSGLPAERGAQAVHHQERGPLGRGTNRSGPKRCSGKVLGLIRLPSVPFLGAFSVGIARKRPRLLRRSAWSDRVMAASFIQPDSPDESVCVVT